MIKNKPLILILVLFFATALYFLTKAPEVKIGYFHGTRATLLFRAYINNEFEKEGVKIKLITKGINQPEFTVVPKNLDLIKNNPFYGTVSGRDLVSKEGLEKFDGATVGESSFIEAVGKNTPLIAVAMLGHDTRDRPDHAIIFRKDININTPEDIKGKVLASPRGGFGNFVFLREFLASEGIDPKKDVKIVDNVSDDTIKEDLVSGKIDGGYFDLLPLASLVNKNIAYVYRKFDWVNPELSQVLLVFKKDFVKKHPDQVKNIIRAYMKRVKYEHSLPEEERLKDPGEEGSLRATLQMEKDFQGMNLPQYDFPPLVREDLLGRMQGLLIKWGYIDKKLNLADFIDNSFVEKIYNELK